MARKSDVLTSINHNAIRRAQLARIFRTESPAEEFSIGTEADAKPGFEDGQVYWSNWRKSACILHKDVGRLWRPRHRAPKEYVVERDAIQIVQGLTD